MSEVVHELDTDTEAGGVSRRRVVAGVAWSLPVIATAIASPAAAASGPVPPTTATPASGSFVAGTQAITSTVSNAHDRAGVSVPSTLSLRNLGGVTGNVQVALTITPQPAAAAAPAVSLSTIHLGSAAVPVTTGLTGNTFTANFSRTVTAGTTTLDFLLGGYSYSGKKQDGATYAVTALVTLQEGGTTKQLTPVYSITLVKL